MIEVLVFVGLVLAYWLGWSDAKLDAKAENIIERMDRLIERAATVGREQR